MRHLTSIIIVILAFASQVNAAIPSAPDFAFPKKVSANAQSELKTALANSNSVSTVRSLMDFALAQGAIDSDNLPGAIHLIDSVRHLPSVSPATKAVLTLLTADIYSQIYNQQRWTYDQRKMPLSPRPASYLEWSGDQFRDYISALADSALSQTQTLKAEPLDQWKAVITCNDESRPVFPTLYDFAAYKAISYFETGTYSTVPMPLRWICPANKFVTLSFGYLPTQKQKILTTYQQLLSNNAGHSPAWIYGDIQRLKFIAENVTEPSSDNVFNTLIDMFDASFKSSYSGLVLLEMPRYANNATQRRTIYSLCEKWLAKYAPASTTAAKDMSGAIRWSMSQLKQQQISADFNNVTTNNRPLEIHLTNNNTPECTIDIYRLPDSYRHGDRMRTLSPASFRKVQTLNVSFGRNGIFETDTTVTLAPLTYGNYLVAISLPDRKFNFKNIGYGHIFTVSDIALQCASFGNKASIFTLNPFSGAPLANVSLHGLDDKNAHTDHDGRYHITQNLTYQNQIIAQSGNDRFALPLQLYHLADEEKGRWRSVCNLFTDLAIYHPGDTVRFGGVAYEYFTQTGQTSKLATQTEITAILYNANGIDIDTLTCTSDDWGRIQGQFAIPSDGLTGNFRIRLNHKFSGSSVSFMVSDYKLPTYTLSVTDIQRNSPADGDITVSVKAETYSGFPVISADVNLRLSQMARNWWWRGNNGGTPFYTTQAKTDANGIASFILPSQLLDDAPITNGIFRAAFSAVSATGETQETSTSFSKGPAYIIALSFPANFNISGNHLELPVSVTDLSDNTVKIPLQYTLKQNGQIIHKGDLSTESHIVDWSHIKSGSYTITVSAVDSTLAEAATATDIVLYRPTDKNMPVTSDLWIPETSYSVRRGENARILYGTSNADASILCTVWTADSIMTQRWLHPGQGVHFLEIPGSGISQETTVTLSTIHGFNQTTRQVSVVLNDIPSSLKIEIEAFRDHITPGQTEQWKLRINDNTGHSAASAVILDMYAKAIDALTPHDISINFASGYGKYFRLGYNSSLGKENIYCQSRLGKSVYLDINRPTFNTYRQSFLPTNNIMIRGTHKLMSSAATADLSFAREHKEEIVIEETADAGAMVEVSARSYNSAAPAMGVTEIAIVNDDEVARENDNGDKINTADQYRMPEMPIALFRPMLTTDAQGHMEFSFTAPDANTTWRLCAAAFSKDMLSGTATREIISNKPVMVQPNFPRFLRSGDTVDIMSSVMNNTDSSVTAVTAIEIFDPTTMHVMATRLDTLAIASLQSAVIPYTLHAPADAPFIGFRIRTAVPGFSDGEQKVIPVLAATTPVIETHPFYMNPDSTHMTFNIPESGRECRVTLQLCENPAWYCVTALPGLRTDDSNTANSAAAAIFSAAIADGLMRDYPEIGRAIQHWTNSDRSDSTLVSMLERNQDLKTVLLSSTPWMMDARSDTERMERLALLFDKNEIKRCYARNIALLSKLSSKGGWAWTESFHEPSLWTTYNVLEIMGRLKQLGYLPDNNRLRNMIDSALDYIDAEAAKSYARYPQSDYTQYTWVRNYFKDRRQSTASSAVIAVTIQRLVKNWRNMSVTGKAIAAILLNGHNYKTMSRQILTSLREYAKSTPENGMWWPSLDQSSFWSYSKVSATSVILDAFAAIDPASKDIDRIRQWLIIQKEVENWGTSVNASDVIASILTTGSKWLSPAQQLTVTIDGKQLATDSMDTYLGYIRTDISDATRDKTVTLTVHKQSATPAWGAVYRQYTAAMDSVAAAGCDAVTIDKRIFVSHDTATGVEWIETPDFTTGNRVRVQLTIRATRDMDYVTIIDDRAAAFEPVNQLPEPIFAEGICFYQENRDSSTRMFVRRMPKGIYLLTYELNVNNAGRFASGIATVQSQYAPQLSAHSSGSIINVK